MVSHILKHNTKTETYFSRIGFELTGAKSESNAAQEETDQGADLDTAPLSDQIPSKPLSRSKTSKKRKQTEIDGADDQSDAGLSTGKQAPVEGKAPETDRPRRTSRPPPSKSLKK